MDGSTDAIPFCDAIAGVGGQRLELPGGSDSPKLVQELRMEVAIVLQRPPGLIDLFINENHLQDSQFVHRIDGSKDSLLVMIKCCEAAPESYEEYIGRVKVDGIWDAACLVPSVCAQLKTPYTTFNNLPQTLEFPPPQNININMMPFVLGEKSSIPEEFQHYWPLILYCMRNTQISASARVQNKFNERRAIGYLTIHESLTAAGQSQRRPGIHTESPGVMMLTPGNVVARTAWGGSQAWSNSGIFMASNITGSLKVWPVQLRDEVIGHMGDCEHLRELLGDGHVVQGGELIWLTDHTPHESVPLETEAYRQYFRVVVGEVSIWYSKNSTANRLGVVPDPEETRILETNKFAGSDVA